MYYLYELHDPITGELCYVGITNNPEKRKKQHLQGISFAFHIYAIKWAHRIQEIGDVDMRIVGTYPIKTMAKIAEKKRINQLADEDYPLVNSNYYFSRKRITQIDLQNRFERTSWYRNY